MATALLCLPNPEDDPGGSGAQHDDSSISTGEGQKPKIPEPGSHHSSSAHTDSEDDNKLEGNNNVQDQINKNVIPDTNTGTTQAPNNQRITEDVSEKLRRSHHHHTRFRDGENKSSEDEDSSSDNHNSQRDSYIAYKIARRKMLKIERLTDSDSRSREKMRKRGLSPPSSSDEENLHIGWVAYPIITTLPRSSRNESSNNQRPLCACVEAFKCLFSPVAKVCNLCSRHNKVRGMTPVEVQNQNGTITRNMNV